MSKRIGQKSVDAAQTKLTKKQQAGQLAKQKDATWKACSLYVRTRDKFCVLCGSPFNLQAGHVIKRGRGSTLFDLTNVNAQCSSCNIRHNHYPEFYNNWYIKKYGQEAFDALVAKSWELKVDWTIDELKELEDGFNRLTAEMDGNERV